MKKIKKILTMLVILFGMIFTVYGENNSLLIKGLEAYKQKDWVSALFFLRKAATQPENINPETWYVLVMSEVYASDFEGVLTDGAYFLYKFPESPYVPQIKYQMARGTFLLEDYNQALVMFEEFCNQYPEHELFSSALFWKAETLYQAYNFNEAETLFKRVINEYPESPKVVEAAFRIELLEQREKEEKLLYLLRVTGEENLAAREDYERQIRQYQSEESINFKMKVTELSLLVESLQEELTAANTRIETLLAQVNELNTENKGLLESLEISKKQMMEAKLNAEQLISEYEQQLFEKQKILENQKEVIKSEDKITVVGSGENQKNDESQIEDINSLEYELQELKKKAKELEELLDR